MTTDEDEGQPWEGEEYSPLRPLAEVVRRIDLELKKGMVAGEFPHHAFRVYAADSGVITIYTARFLDEGTVDAMAAIAGSFLSSDGPRLTFTNYPKADDGKAE